MTSKPFHNIFGVSQSPLVDLMSFNSFFVGTYFKRLTTVFFTKTLKVFKRDNTIASQITKNTQKLTQDVKIGTCIFTYFQRHIQNSLL